MMQYLHMHAARPRPSARVRLTAAVDAEVTRAMAVDPAQRHPVALAFHAALRAAVEGAEPAGGTLADAIGVWLALGHAEGEDRDRVIQLAQLMLARAGFWLATERGDGALFVAAAVPREQVQKVVTSAARAVEARHDAHPELRVAWYVHRAPVLMHGDTATTGPLFELATWGMPEEPAGVWYSAAV
jgi:hypothetical protein